MRGIKVMISEEAKEPSLAKVNEYLDYRYDLAKSLIFTWYAASKAGEEMTIREVAQLAIDDAETILSTLCKKP